MKTYRCQVAADKKLQKLFLRLPKKLYGADCPQDRKTEIQLLKGIHPLSGSFQVIPFVTTDEDGEVLCRCMLTYYPGEIRAYLGFFEAYYDLGAVKEMLRIVENRAILDGKKELIGPVDASIYIGYRFKTDRFDKTYTGEPYNKPYYPELWEKFGFTVCDRYLSNRIRVVEQEDIDPRLSFLHERYERRGYRFLRADPREFDRYLGDIWQSMMELYSGFTGFQRLSREQFFALFSDLKSVLNFDMVKLVYREDKLRAFGICLPNYGSLTRGKRTPWKLLQILRLRRNPKEYVILYVGADPSAPGLGGALAHEIRNSLYRNRCTSIGALIKEGNVTAAVYDALYTEQFHYVLFTKSLINH